MRRLVMASAVIIALSVPITVGTVALAGPATAASGIQCKGIKGNIAGNVTISKCKPSGGAGYKTATGVATSLASSGTLTWSKSGATTTIHGGSATAVSPNKCAPAKGGGGEFTFTATVSAASTVGTGIPAVGDSVSATACISSTGAITLLPHTVMHL